MKEIERQLRILQIIRVNGNVNYLINTEYSPTDLHKDLSLLKERGIYEECQNRSIRLTKNGEKYFHQLCKKLNRKGMYRYYDVLDEDRITPLSADEIYIPLKYYDILNEYRISPLSADEIDILFK